MPTRYLDRAVPEAGLNYQGLRWLAGQARYSYEFNPYGGCGWFHACVVSGVIDPSPQIEPTSTASLLMSLSLAIDEIKLIRSIKNLTVMIGQLELEKPSSHRLLFQKREISILESRLAKIRSKASRIKTVIKLPKFK